MRRSDRLFDIIQALRTARQPMTAAALAALLEVTPRTVYRDIATLQARRVPIEGAAGLGYVLRRGFDLPPLMFTEEEIEAIAVAARLLVRTGDLGLQAAAESVLSKVTVGLPEALRDQLAQPAVFVSEGDTRPSRPADLSGIRAAIRAERKLRIRYASERGETTERVVWPVAIAYYVQVTLIGAWCELRQDFRHFRTDRVQALTVLEDRFPESGRTLTARWMRRFTADPRRPAPRSAAGSTP
jgi:predicted DNA-binding transcriptional regulator YafY